MTVEVRSCTGAALGPLIDAIARLRIAVFREWPYLYDGDPGYERDYLAGFASCPDAVAVAAIHGEAVIGVATASPLLAHTSEFAPLFAAAGVDPGAVFYLGESVLLPGYRGQGIGHRFFDAREAHARALNLDGQRFTHLAFCAVVREEGDPRRPAGSRSLDGFWQKRGYRSVPGLVGSYRWREIGCPDETSHPMQFWMRSL